MKLLYEINKSPDPPDKPNHATRYPIIMSGGSSISQHKTDKIDCPLVSNASIPLYKIACWSLSDSFGCVVRSQTIKTYTGREKDYPEGAVERCILYYTQISELEMYETILKPICVTFKVIKHDEPVKLPLMI